MERACSLRLPERRGLRGLAVALTATSLLTIGVMPAAATGRGSNAEVEVRSTDCTSVRVSSSKAISNVVLLFADGDSQRFEGLPESRTGTFAGTGHDSGETIVTAWVKSGNNASGDGPGYGERFDLGCTAEDPDDPTDPEEPEDPREPEDPEEPTDPREPEDPDEEEPDDVPPPPLDIDDPDDELPPPATDGGEDFDEGALNAVDESDPTDRDPQVLGVQEANGVVAAEVATAELPSAGSTALTTLAAALASFALGGTLLRRTRRSTATRHATA